MWQNFFGLIWFRLKRFYFVYTSHSFFVIIKVDDMCLHIENFFFNGQIFVLNRKRICSQIALCSVYCAVTLQVQSSTTGSVSFTQPFIPSRSIKWVSNLLGNWKSRVRMTIWSGHTLYGIYVHHGHENKLDTMGQDPYWLQRHRV